MALHCTRCEGTGFLNTQQIPDEVVAVFEANNEHKIVLDWIAENDDHDVQVCDCCGDGESWYGTPGEHYNSGDMPGPDGPYAGNGGLCCCH